MASSGFIILYFTFSYISAKKAFVTVQCKTEQERQYGQKSMLDCLVIVSEEVADPQILLVNWKKEGAEEPLLLYDEGKTEHLPRFSFAESPWNDRNMNVSLLITDTAVQDEDVYTCDVMMISGGDSSQTRLKVTAKYKTPNVTLKPDEINHDTLTCNTDGGYPEGRLHWFDEYNTEWTQSAEMEAKQTKSGLFQLSSRLTLLSGIKFSKYTCVVFNASGGREDEAILEIAAMRKKEGQGQSDKRQGLDPVHKVVAPLVVIGSLIVGLLLTLLYYKRRRQHEYQRNHQGLNTHDSNFEEGEL